METKTFDTFVLLVLEVQTSMTIGQRNEPFEGHPFFKQIVRVDAVNNHRNDKNAAV